MDTLKSLNSDKPSGVSSLDLSLPAQVTPQDCCGDVCHVCRTSLNDLSENRLTSFDTDCFPQVSN